MKNDTGERVKLRQLAAHEWKFEFPRMDAAVSGRFEEALEAMRSGDLAGVVELLQQLLKDFPEHIDARHHLAIVLDATRRPAKALREWCRAVETGLAALPPTFVFGRDLLEWGWLENRPFLRAYTSLGIAYQERGLLGEACTILENVLDLNPNDNQGVRTPIMECLFALRRPRRVLDLSERFQEYQDMTVLYGRALALLQLGQTGDARTAAAAAVEAYPLAAEELLKTAHTPPPQEFPGYLAYGGEDEAYDYWTRFGEFWKRTPGALDLLKPGKPRKPRGRPSR